MPNTAVPKELPSVRKKVTPEVAVPRSEYSTVFCTAMVSTCMDSPMPVPSTNMYSDSSPAPVSGPISDIRYRPTPITSVPAMGNSR